VLGSSAQEGAAKFARWNNSSRMLTQEREAFYDDAVRLLRRLQRPGAVRRLMLRISPEKT
jgi:hypothetical protein